MRSTTQSWMCCPPRRLVRETTTPNSQSSSGRSHMNPALTDWQWTGEREYMPLLWSLVGRAVCVAINMALLTELCTSSPLSLSLTLACG